MITLERIKELHSIIRAAENNEIPILEALNSMSEEELIFLNVVDQRLIEEGQGTEAEIEKEQKRSRWAIFG